MELIGPQGISAKEKVLYISFYCPFPLSSGGKVGTWNKIKEVSSVFDVILCGLSESDDFIDSNELSKYCVSFKFYKRKKEKIQILFHPFLPIPVATRISHDLNKFVKRTIEEENIKIVILDSIHMYSAIKNLKIPGISIFVNEHNYEYKLYRSLAKSAKWPLNLVYKIESLKIKRLENNLLKNRQVKGLVFVNNNERLDYCKETKTALEKTCCVPVFYPMPNNRAYRDYNIDILCVSNFSTISNREGVVWFLENCLPNILKERPTLRCFLIGRKTTEKMEIYTKKFSNHFFAIGPVDDVYDFYKSAKLVVIPLFQGGGVKIKLLEAASYSKLIVTTSKTLEGTRFDGRCLYVGDDASSFIQLCLLGLSQSGTEKGLLKIDALVKLFQQDYSFDVQADIYRSFIDKLS